VGCAHWGKGGWKERRKGGKTSANEVLHQSWQFKKMAAFSYLPHFSMPSKKYGIVQDVCIVACDVVYHINFVNIIVWYV
jgi:hypothetical protein